MFKRATVFILGAGASWHYGYPTGEELVEEVINMAERFRKYAEHRRGLGINITSLPLYGMHRYERSTGVDGAKREWEKIAQECKLLAERLRSVRPLVIDYFLYWNESLHDIGRLMIAAVILQCEEVQLRTGMNDNRRKIFINQPQKRTAQEFQSLDVSKYRDNWIRFVVHKLINGVRVSPDLLKNDVRFVTFNYDTSFEDHLVRALKSLDILKQNDIDKFLSEDRVIHVYGSIHPTPDASRKASTKRGFDDLGGSISTDNFVAVTSEIHKFLDDAYKASKGIRTIEQHDKDQDDVLNKVKTRLAMSKLVYILGYGFDENNSKRIGLNDHLGGGARIGARRSVLLTNYEDSGAVNKRASRLLWSISEHLTEKSIWGTAGAGDYVEKTTRNVYDALERDFEAIEELP